MERRDAAFNKMSSPMWLTNQYVRKSCLMLSIAFLFLFLNVTLVSITKIHEFHKLTHRDYLVWNDYKTWDWDKSMLVKEYLVVGSGEAMAPLQT